MLLLERYIIREIAAPQSAICAVLVAVFAGYSATRLLNDAVNGLLSSHAVVLMVLLRVLIALEVLLPVTLYLGVILGLGRLYADGEITAMEAVGVGRGRIVKSVFLLALPIAALVTGLSLYIRPWAYGKIYALEARAQEEFNFSKVEAGRFYEIGQKLVFFAETVDPVKKRARNVRIWETTPKGREVTFAHEAHQRTVAGEKVLVFNNGYHYRLSLEANRDRIVAFEESVLHPKPVVIPCEYRRKAASTTYLSESTVPEDIAESQWRLSTGPATFLLALLAIPLSRLGPRRSKYGKANVAIILFFIYYNLSLIAKNGVENRVVPPRPGIWWVNLLLAALVMVLFFHSEKKWSWRRRRRSGPDPGK